MAIDDAELREVWPQVSPGVPETKKDHYCNLILNLQKVAYETKTIELEELRGALRYLMRSRDMYLFWSKALRERMAVTGGDDAEDFFTAEVDRAFKESGIPPRANGLLYMLRNTALEWWRTRGSSR